MHIIVLKWFNYNDCLHHACTGHCVAVAFDRDQSRGTPDLLHPEGGSQDGVEWGRIMSLRMAEIWDTDTGFNMYSK